jgi:hypothetical protein
MGTTHGDTTQYMSSRAVLTGEAGASTVPRQVVLVWRAMRVQATCRWARLTAQLSGRAVIMAQAF